MPDIQLDMSCSKGTYARAIARDLGEELAVGARLETLRRTSSGPFEVSQAVDLEFIQKASLTEIHTSIIPLDKVLENIPRIMTGASELKRLSTGGALKISIDRIPGEYLSEKYLQSPFRVSAPSSGLLIIVRLKIDGDSVVVSPEKLFNWLESSLV